MIDLGKVMGSRWLSGAAAPAVGLGLDDDWYLRTTSGDCYKKIAGTWVFQVNLTGNTGAAGSHWTTGTGAPTGGSDGDMYLEVSTGDVYQKVAGVWGIVANITGPAGPAGTNGTNGTNGTTVTSAVADLPASFTTGDLHFSPVDQVVRKAGPTSWEFGAPLILKRYGIPVDDGNYLSGPGWLSRLFGGGATITMEHQAAGPTLRIDVLAQDEGICNDIITKLPSGSYSLDWQVKLRFPTYTGTLVFWAGLLEDFPSLYTPDGGIGSMAVRYNEVNTGGTPDTTLMLVAAASHGASIVESSTSWTPTAGADYVFRFRYKQAGIVSALLELWVFDLAQNLENYTSMAVAPTTDPYQLTVSIGDASSNQVDIYELATQY